MNGSDRLRHEAMDTRHHPETVELLLLAADLGDALRRALFREDGECRACMGTIDLHYAECPAEVLARLDAWGTP